MIKIIILLFVFSSLLVAQCPDGYQVTSTDFQCWPTFCTAYSNPSDPKTCSTCIAGYTWTVASPYGYCQANNCDTFSFAIFPTGCGLCNSGFTAKKIQRDISYYMECVSDALIIATPNCIEWTPSGSSYVCKTCVGNIKYDVGTSSCPSSEGLSSNCRQSSLDYNGKIYCKNCQKGYWKDDSANPIVCVHQIANCRSYGGVPKSYCISCKEPEKYQLKNGACQEKIEDNCQNPSSNGKCTDCKPDFVQRDGVCYQIKTQHDCGNGKYLNSQRRCVSGNVPNCQTYDSPSGTCNFCKSQYHFDDFGNCVQATRFNGYRCPEDTQQYYYVYNAQKGDCEQNFYQKDQFKCPKDKKNDNGTCQSCSDNQYQYLGHCYSIINVDHN